jgi:hypothetical protein
LKRSTGIWRSIRGSVIAFTAFCDFTRDALRFFADSDVIVLTDAVTDRSYPYPMNTKIKEYWDELWEWTNQNRAAIFDWNLRHSLPGFRATTPRGTPQLERPAAGD